VSNSAVPHMNIQLWLTICECFLSNAPCSSRTWRSSAVFFYRLFFVDSVISDNDIMVLCICEPQEQISQPDLWMDFIAK
jgi:hypothetical protein